MSILEVVNKATCRKREQKSMTNKKETLKQIINNGGGNLKAWQPVNYSSGYMVAIEDGTIIDIKDIDSIINYIDSVNGSCGLWVNDGKLYIDISINIESLDEALKIAIEKNELAIFDCKELKDITIESK